ncbi:MAG: sialidase family protein, partial [Chthoniobacteraceae bacterium]
EGGVWVSVDHGATWVKKITATLIYRVARKADGTTFAAGVNSGVNVLYRITAPDWANPATYTATNINSNYNAALPYAPSGDMATVQVMANGDVWAADLFEFTCKSANNGTTFARLPMTLTGPLTGWTVPGTTTVQGGRNGIIQDPALATRFFLGGGYAPYRSDDSGATWRFIANGVGETVAWRACFHPTDANRVWLPIADLGATTVSDGGASGLSTGYIAPHFPYPDDNVTFSHRMLISAGKVIAPGGEQSTHKARIYQTTDNGATWTKLATTGLPTANGREIIDAVASSDNADDFLVFGSGTTGVGAGGIYRTTNGGASFTQATGIPAGNATGDLFYWHPTLERDATNPAVRYLFLRNVGFFKSTDRGATWTKPAAQPRNTYAHLHVDAVTGRIWVGTEFSTGFDYSDNGGATWIATSSFTSVTEFDCHGGRLAAIGTRTGDTFNKIYASADNGVTWDEISRPGNRFATVQAVAIDPWRPGTVWISTNGRAIARFTPWTPLEIWRNANLGSPNASDLADPDFDGFANLLEYARGTSPNSPNSPLTGEITTDSGSNYLSLRVSRDAIHAGITYSIEASADLGTWSATGLVTLANTATLLQIRDIVPLGSPSQATRFLRLKVTAP